MLQYYFLYTPKYYNMTDTTDDLTIIVVYKR